MADDSGPTPPEWQTEAADCGGCVKKFSLMRRRHHCRGCGIIFCDDCSSKRHELPPAFNLKGEQRVCNNCFYTLRASAVAANPSAAACAAPDYDQVFRELVTRLETFIKDDTPEMWKQRAHSKAATFWTTKIKDSPLLCVKARFFLPLALDVAFPMYRDIDNWPKWQPEMTEIRRIERVEHTNESTPECAEVMYARYKLPVVDDRDACIYSCTLPGSLGLGDPTHAKCLVNCSVDHPLAPSMKGVIRAIVSLSTSIFHPGEKDDVKGTWITTLTHSDPRGLIPPFLVNQMVSHAVEQIDDMIKIMTKLAAEGK